MMKLVDQIKYQLSRLKSLYVSYDEHKYNSKHARRKKDRDRATDSMFTYADMIQRTLITPPIAEIILDGGQYQFEDFWKYVDSDMPEYIEKIENRIAELEDPKPIEDSPIDYGQDNE